MDDYGFIELANSEEWDRYGGSPTDPRPLRWRIADVIASNLLMLLVVVGFSGLCMLIAR